MSLTIKPFEQVAAELATLAAIDIGASSAADKYARAQVALQVATAAQSLSSGDVATFSQTVQTAILAKVTDAGQQKVVTDLFGIANVFLLPAAQVDESIPLVSVGVAAIANNVAAGITAVASQYKAPAPTSSAKTETETEVKAEPEKPQAEDRLTAISAQG